MTQTNVTAMVTDAIKQATCASNKYVGSILKNIPMNTAIIVPTTIHKIADGMSIQSAEFT